MTFPGNGTWLSTTEFAICLTFVIICTAFIGLRLWARTIQKGLRPRALTRSDYLAIVGYLATVGNTTCMLVAIAIGGSGQHADRLTDETKETGQKALFAAAFFWLTATCMLKISILLLYTEIFQSQMPRRIAYGLIALVAAFFVGCLVTIFTQCFPFSMNWDKTQEGHCSNLTAESRAGAFINMIFDTMITIFPIPMVWALQMPIRKRIGIILLFGVGTAADCVNISRAVITMNPSGEDYSYSSGKTNILAAMELWLGVIIACVPLIKPALIRLRIMEASTPPGRFSAGVKGSGSQPVYRPDVERAHDSGYTSTKGSAPLDAVKTLDPWERQFKYLESDEDMLPLRDLSHCSTPDPRREYLVS